ncbi:hypothetical protein D3C76_1644120 [compost metagenome]
MMVFMNLNHREYNFETLDKKYGVAFFCAALWVLDSYTRNSSAGAGPWSAGVWEGGAYPICRFTNITAR